MPADCEFRSRAANSRREELVDAMMSGNKCVSNGKWLTSEWLEKKQSVLLRLLDFINYTVKIF